MSNTFYNPSGNPATGSEGLSALIRSEFAAIGTAFDSMPRITTTGLSDTVFAQQGSYTFTLPSTPGTLALRTDVDASVAAEATARAAADALLAPLAGPHLTGTTTIDNVAIAAGAVNGATIGATTPSTGAFTALAASGAVSGAGFTARLATPGPIGNTAPSTGAFTSLSASGTVSGAGFVAWSASPGPIGSVTPSTGAFTAIFPSAVASPTWSLSADATFNTMTWQSGGGTWSVRFNKSTGQTDWVNQAGVAMSLLSAGALQVFGSNTVSASGFAYSPTGGAAFATQTIAYSINALGNVLATNLYAVSDVRLKRRIEPISEATAMQWLLTANPVSYDKLRRWDDETSYQHEAGFVAQEQLAAGFAEYAGVAECPGLPALDDGAIRCPENAQLTLPMGYQIAHLTRAVQALEARLAALEAR